MSKDYDNETRRNGLLTLYVGRNLMKNDIFALEEGAFEGLHSLSKL